MKIPTDLSPASTAWVADIVDHFEIDPHHERLLTLAAQAWDRCQEARALLDKDGIIIGGREGGSRAHPAVAVERDSRAAFAALVKQLQLDGDDDKRPPGRPAGIFHAANGRRLT